jgi:NADP-dependent 3-hydroxy acid dehydrogenase YdfG
MPPEALSGKIALVTGASSGVGRSIALELAKQGANLALVGRRTELLKAVERECHASRVQCFTVDLLQQSKIQQLQNEVMREFGGVDILIHSAGVFAMAPFADATLEDFDRQFQCNVRAPFALTQTFLPSLIERKGQIVFINSTAGLTAGAGVSQYAATKHALKAIADSLRDEVNAEGVRVLSVFLGRTASPMQAEIHQLEGKTYDPDDLIQPEQVAQAVAHTLVVGKQAEITEIRIRPMRKPRP